MINKKNLWFLTLFSLILVLSVYYVTMPNELLLTNSSATVSKTKEEKTVVEESDILTSLRVESDEKVSKEIDELKQVLTDSNSSLEEKNEAFSKMKDLNNIKAKEEELEKKINDEFKLSAFVKIENDQIKVVIKSDKHDYSLANKIMRSIQSNYDKKMYITVEFKK
ncbi:MAG: SpoIIIAH-like family protein [Bacilli bacterium]|nr:SpoIIIAH-like family protein [Bacilli bacterium]